jgi:hypothetical protein
MLIYLAVSQFEKVGFTPYAKFTRSSNVRKRFVNPFNMRYGPTMRIFLGIWLHLIKREGIRLEYFEVYMVFLHQMNRNGVYFTFWNKRNISR